MSLHNKLNRFKKHLTSVGHDSRTSKQTDTKTTKILDFDPNKWTDYQAFPAVYEDQYCIVRERFYGNDTKIGHYTVQDLHDVVERWNENDHSHPLASNGREAGDLLFFDTETTGLGSGVGNTIFLLGVARVLENGIRVRQYFLPGPGNEVALYHHFLTDVQDMSNLVTYNGKAFDWPQVKTRHTLVRDLVPKLPPFGHFDLLHGSRRIWKHSYESLRLSVVENELLNIERKEDTPGYLAPMLYFEFLREKDPSILEGVFKHNELDVLTLLSLYTHLSKVLLDRRHTSLTTMERFEIARWFDALDSIEEAVDRYEDLLDTKFSVKAKKALAEIYKKKKNTEKAVCYWKSVIEHEEDVDSYIELAKVYEHKYKDLDKALYFARKGYDAWKSAKRILRDKEEKERELLHKRIVRIEGKIG